MAEPGFSDFLNAPLVGLLHGLVMGVFGGLMLYMAWDRFWVLAGALSGFLLVAPVLSTGLYAVSRALGRGEDPDLGTRCSAGVGVAGPPTGDLWPVADGLAGTDQGDHLRCA